MVAGRNDPCPCGSGKKYKKCCLREEDALTSRVQEVRHLLESVEGQLEEYAVALYGEDCLDEAWETFAEGSEDLEINGPEMQIFVPWVHYDWKPKGGRNGQYLAASFMQDHGADLSADERQVLEAAFAAPMSFHDVVEVRQGQGVVLRDILLGGERDVVERSGSQTLQVGDIVFARVVPFGPFALMVGSGAVPFPPIEKRVVLDLRKSLQGVESDRAAILKRALPELKTLYFGVAHRLMNPVPPKMCNTDGDPLEFHTLMYRTIDATEAFESLKSLAWGLADSELLVGAEFGKNGELRRVEFPWQVKGNKVNKTWDNTVLGHIEIDGRSLKVTVNSAKRAARIRKEIEKRLENFVTFVEDAVSSLEDALAKENRKQKSPKGALETAKAEEENARLQALPEVQTMMKQYIERHWESWIDEKIPALGGKTPRQAVRDRDGREMVEALLLDSERMDKKRGIPPVDYKVIRARLGLKAD
jgi:hypothetical protein